jgi:hypothetical protein
MPGALAGAAAGSGITGGGGVTLGVGVGWLSDETTCPVILVISAALKLDKSVLYT